MLYPHRVTCPSQIDFDNELEIAYGACLETDHPIHIAGYSSPKKQGGKGTGGILFSFFREMVQTKEKISSSEVIYHVWATFDIDRLVFDISHDLIERLRLHGKIVGYSDWEIDNVTHIVTIPFNGYDWEYGLICTDADAIITLLRFGTQLRRGTRVL